MELFMTEILNASSCRREKKLAEKPIVKNKLLKHKIKRKNINQPISFAYKSQNVKQKRRNKSCIQETLNLSMCAESSIDNNK